MNDQLVTILDSESLQPLFSGANIMRVTVRNEKRATQFPVEDGSERSDHVIVLAKEIEIDYILTDEAKLLHDAIKQAFTDNRLVTVQTKVDSYPNMLIESIPHDETAEANGIPVNVHLIEWVSVAPSYSDAPMRKSDVKSSKQASTVQRGQQTPATAPAPKAARASVAHGLFN